MLAISSLLLVVVISLLITRVAAVVLVATGLSQQAARFQARSAFTGAGFTTSESERVVDHPVRRRVIAVLMLVGNAGVVAAASSVILGFRGNAVGHAWWRILELVAGLAVLVWLSRSRWVDRWLTRRIGRALRRFTDLTTTDAVGLLRLPAGYAVHELGIEAGDWVTGAPLGELDLESEDIRVLGLVPSGGGYVGTPDGDRRLGAGDVAIVYGDRQRLVELDHRPLGPQGDAAHRAGTRHGPEGGETAAG